MRLLNTLFASGCLLGVLACSAPNDSDPSLENLTQYVDPYIGTGGHGHVFLGANVPFGFVQLGPTQYTQGWDWCSGYHYSDSILVGFSHLHLSGTGIGDLGDITFLPATNDKREYRFTHEQEKVKPGYYSVVLPEANVTVELTATQRAGFHRYQFPASDRAKIVIDLLRGIGWDEAQKGFLKQENDTVVSGYRISRGWANHQQVYFTAVFSKPIKEFWVSDGASVYKKENTTGKVVLTEKDATRFRESFVKQDTLTSATTFGELSFDFAEAGDLYVKIGLSPVSIENARLNMEAEIPGWDFEKTIADADKAWNAELNKVQIKTTNEKDKRIFYTALYHSLFAPSLFGDVNGDYRGSDGEVRHNADFRNFTTFSLWDTYRAAHPLATLIHPQESKDYGKTMLAIFNEQGKLPVWHLMGNETDCMVGNPGIPVLADLVLKGYDIDPEAAFQAMKTSALLDERSLGLLKEYGYIPFDKEPSNETVAKALEYALADWCVAQVAKQLGRTDDYNYFQKRSQSYSNYFDKESRFMRALSSDGKFREPFNPFHAAHRVNDYTEGNAWQYTWLVPHDVHGLVGLFGSEEAFVGKLDSLFTVEGDMGEHASPDITGLIGQYAHGNEPSHQIVYMYPYVGQQWKTAEKARYILDNLYWDAPDGLCGNEDVGQMSAWYLLSSLGFYQVAPAGGVYVFGSPLFDEATLQVGNEKTFRITAHNQSKKNIYIQQVKLNGKEYTKSYITYPDIVAGGTLEFFLGDQPSATFGVAREDRP